MEVDCIIVGQGIAGTMLSYQLLQNNLSCIVIDESKPNTASKVASGVINPITGRRFVKTWMIDELMPTAKQQYQSIEQFLNIDIFKETQVIDFHPTLQMQEAFNKRAIEETRFLNAFVDANSFHDFFNFNFELGQISPCYLIDINKLISSWRFFLTQEKIIIEENFDEAHLIIQENQLQYKNIKAKKIIYCNGVNAMQSKWFKYLPFAPNKGEALLVQIPNLNNLKIYKQGFSLVPWEKDIFWLGSSYEWNFKDSYPSNEFKLKAEKALKDWLKIPFTIVDHLASIRPTNTERRPFVGFLNHQPHIGILNGLGTKGCSLAPYFSKELIQNFLENKPIHQEADVNRFLHKKATS